MPKFAGKTLIDLLKFRAEQQPDKVAYIFLVDGEDEEISITYRVLDQKARAIAAHLQEGFQIGDRALLIYQPGLEFIAGFFGCLYAGMIAVPVYPPIKKNEIERFVKVLKNSQAKVALLDPIVQAGVQLFQSKNPEIEKEFADLHFVITEEVPLEITKKWRKPKLTDQSIAFLQYTSGSTGDPKGVIVSHGNLLNNEECIKVGFQQKSDSTVVGWLPVYHDMGLIGNVLQPMYLGILCVLMSPIHFLQKPFRWLRAISKYRATTSGGPNFAFELCNKRVTEEQLSRLDLSSWNVAFNGAEPIRGKTLEKFYQKFKKAGLDIKSFYPCYGLAEATLLVTGSNVNKPYNSFKANLKQLQENTVSPSERGEKYKTLVSSGIAYLDNQVIVVDPLTMTVLPENQIGEIWIKGKSVAKGYWNQPTFTQETFQAYTTDSLEGPFLRSGDLGFLREGQLYVTGRLKDLIIIRGTNHYPQDIELSVAHCHPAIRSGCVAAFSVDKNDEEKLVVVAEKKNLDKTAVEELYEAIQAAIFNSHNISIYDICFIKPKSIPKTSSGKIQRSLCKQKYLANTLLEISRLKKTENERKIKQQANDTVIKDKTDQKSGIYYDIEGEIFSEEQKNKSKQKTDELLQWLRTYAKSRINSRLIDERRTIPPYIILDLGNQGILGCQVPEKYGGLGLTHTDTMRMVEQLVAIDTTIASLVGINNFLGIRPILRHAQEEIKSQWLPELAKGRQLAGLAVTEEGAGSNIQKIQTVAVRQSDGSWLLNGKKVWIGSGSWAGILNIFAKNEADHQIMAFAVEQGTLGLTQGPEAMTMGMRGMVQNSILMNDALVEDKNALGNGINGIDVLHDSLSYTRLALGASSVGGIKRCMQLMYEYASKRTISTGILLENPVTLERMNELDLSATALEALVYSITEKLDEGISIPVGILSICKIIGPELFFRATDHLMQLLGGRGYIETSEVPQIFRDTRLMRIFEGPTEALTMFLGALKQAEDEIFKYFLIKHYEAPDLAACLKNDSDHVYSFWEDNAKVFGGQADHEHTAKMHIGNLVCYTFLQAASNYFYQKTGSIEYRNALLWAKAKYDCILSDALKLQTVHQLWRNTEDIAFRVNTYSDSIGRIEKNMFGEDHNPDVVSHNKIVRELDLEVEDRVTRTGSNETNKKAVQQIEQSIIRIIVEVTQIKIKDIDAQKNISSYGIDSISSIEIITKISEEENIELSPDLLWEFDSINELSLHVYNEKKKITEKNNEFKTYESSLEIKPLTLDYTKEYPISEGQKGLWFIHQVNPKDSSYNILISNRLELNLNTEKLRLALQGIVRKYPVLNVVFVETKTGSKQIFNKEPVVTFIEKDLMNVDDKVIKNTVIKDSKVPFNLETGPLVRAHLYQIGFNKYIFTLVIHHIVCDAMSLKILYEELWDDYFSVINDNELKNKNKSFSYLEYAYYLDKLLFSDKGSQLKKFWMNELADHSHRFKVKEKYLSRKSDGDSKIINTIVIEEYLYKKIGHFAFENKVPVSVILFSIFQWLLYKYSEKKEFTIDMAVTLGRENKALRDSIGYFVNLLPITFDILLDNSCINYLKYTKKKVFQAIKNKEYPYTLIAQDLSSNGHKPLSNVMFNYLSYKSNYYEDIENKYKIKLEPYEIPQQENVSDLLITFLDNGKTININFICNKAYRFSRNNQFLKSYIKLVDAFLVNPTLSLNNLILQVNDFDEDAISDGIDKRENIQPTNSTIHGLFEAQVEKTPHNVALVFNDRVVRYSQLNEKANQLAWDLRKKYKIKPDDLIGVLAKKSEKIIITILAILKSGAAYLFIDPSYPLARKRLILKDANVKALFVDGADKLKEEYGVSFNKLINLYTHTEIVNSPINNINSSNNLAYVAYTSGSTGEPKGVMIEHKSVIRLTVNPNYIKFSANDKLLQTGSLAFDAATFEIWGMLLNGGSVYLSSPTDLVDISNFKNILLNNSITTLFLTTAWFNQLVDIDINMFRKLKYLLVGGEKESPRCMNAVYQQYPRLNFIHVYGPTENTTFSTWYPVKKRFSHDIPIGKPISNTYVFILNSKNELVSIGEEGELFLGGIGLARGYLNKEELTNEKFISDPFNEGKRLYATGDIVRWLPDGNIEFIGREDEQVKIRGYRIELAEIESHLLKIKGIRQSIVLMAKEHLEKRLVAYFIAKEEIDINYLKDKLSTMLPSYMVPKEYIQVGEIPLTSNGKVDKKALLALCESIRTSHRGIRQKNEIENIMLKLWKNLIGVKGIGVDDNFFDIGGHSLMAARFIYDINRDHDLNLKVADIFNYPTISSLSQVVLGIDKLNNNNNKSINLKEESYIDFNLYAIKKLTSKYEDRPNFILLTGATGFVGSYLLSMLLKETSAHIYCVIRARNKTDAKKRLILKLKNYDLYDSKVVDKVIPILGNLAKPNLGIKQNEYSELCDKVDFIYHAAAHMDHHSNYDQLKQVNVGSNREIIKLSTTKKLKKVVYISTAGVFSPDNPRERYEDDSIEQENHPYASGYNASKWVGEKMMLNALGKGLPIQIYRLGLVTGDSYTGAMPTEQWFPKLLMSCYQLKLYFNDFKIPATPVDFIAKSVVQLSLKDSIKQKVFHLVNPSMVKLGQFFQNIIGLDQELKEVSAKAWLIELKKRSKIINLPIMPFIDIESEEITNVMKGKSELEMPRLHMKISCSQTLGTLKQEVGIEYPDMTEYASKYLTSIVKNHNMDGKA